MKQQNHSPILIIGAGMAGLACTLRLQQAGLPCRLLEASARAGGRVGSDRRDGFVLDRGFQVLLRAYPEARRILEQALGQPAELLARSPTVRPDGFSGNGLRRDGPVGSSRTFPG